MGNLLDSLSDRCETKIRILHAIDRPVRDLTIDEVCDLSGVSRSTFYRHFKTREDFYFWYALLCGHLALDQIGRTLSWPEGMRRHFSLLAEEKEFLVYCAEREPSCGTEYMESRRREIIFETLREFRHVEVTEELRFQVACYTHLEAWAAPRWFRTHMAVDPMVFAERLEGCVPSLLHQSMQLP